MLSTVNIKGMEIVPPKNTSGAYDTHPNMPIAPINVVVNGKRRAGKTVCCINLIEKMDFDYVIAVSPTMNSNKEIMSRLNIEHVFEDPDDLSCIDKISKIRTKRSRVSSHTL